MDDFGPNEAILKSIKTLSRGLMAPDHHVALKGHRQLYSIGEPALPFLRGLLLELDWSNQKFKELSRYVSGVFSLIHEMNEEVADELRKLLISNGCPEHIRAIVESICEFSIEDYNRYKLCDVDVFEYLHIDKTCDIQPYLTRWLSNVPEHDLMGPERIYIISREEISHSNASGTYLPGLFVIEVAWDNWFRNNSIFFKSLALCIERALYHEIGHYVHRHTFGQDPVQEREADRYASRIMRSAHPYLHLIARFLHKTGFRSRKRKRWGQALSFEGRLSLTPQSSGQGTAQVFGASSVFHLSLAAHRLRKRTTTQTNCIW